MTELKSDALKAADFAEAEVGQTLRGNPAERREGLRLSETRIAFYLLVSGIISFTILRLLTDQEMVIALGTLSLAIIGMWVCAFLSKARLLSEQFFTASSEIQRAIIDVVDRTVVETRVQIKETSREFPIGDQDFSNLSKMIYARCEEANSLSYISEFEWCRYLESAVPGITLQEENKRREHIINALVALGLPISESELHSKASELSRKVGVEVSMDNETDENL